MLTEDPLAAATLAGTFWSSKGWKQPPESPSADARAHAVAAGYMFDDVEMEHDELIERITQAAATASLQEAADGFVTSLATRQRFLRPFLPSLVIARSMPLHTFDARRHPNVCAVCGAATRLVVERDILSFERHQWGGVRHTSPDFVWFCLDRLAAEGTTGASSDGVELLRQTITALRSLPPATTSTDAVAALAGIRGNRQERLTLLEQLSVVGLLATPEHPGFLRRYTDHADRASPPQRFAERGYPGDWWHAADGLTEEVLDEVFGHLG